MYTNFVSAQSSDRDPVVAHRGAWKAKKLPENSLASLRHAIEMGCIASEFDVRMTADGVLVVNHDPEYHGMAIEKVNYTQLEKFNLENEQYYQLGLWLFKKLSILPDVDKSRLNDFYRNIGKSHHIQ